MTTLNNPFNIPKTDSYIKIIKRTLSNKYNIDYSKKMSYELKNLIQNLLVRDKNKRIKDFDTIKNHSWFKSFDFNILKNKLYKAPNINSTNDILSLNSLSSLTYNPDTIFEMF